MRMALILALAALSACSPRVVTKDRPITVKVPVATPCALPRPLQPGSLTSRTPGWDDMDVRQKAAAVGMWGLDWQTYGEQLNAATAGCR